MSKFLFLTTTTCTEGVLAYVEQECYDRTHAYSQDVPEANVSLLNEIIKSIMRGSQVSERRKQVLFSACLHKNKKLFVNTDVRNRPFSCLMKN
jgi:hypothetical protein